MASEEREFNVRLLAAKLASLKEFAYGAGHELNNPLANIAARAQTLLQDETHPERRRKLAAINAQAMRAHEMIADLMYFARPPRLEPDRVDLGEIVDAVLAELAPLAQSHGTSLVGEHPAEPLWLVADATQLKVALRAVCVNAIEAQGGGGNVQVVASLSGQASSTGEGLALSVSDDGPGFSDEVKEHLFDPFFSGREAGRGLGFGLSKCWSIITAHGGRIEVESVPGQGATFNLWIPSSPPSK